MAAGKKEIDNTKKVKRRRFPIGKLLGGKCETVISACGPVVVGTEHRDGQLLVVVDVPPIVESQIDA